MSSVPDPSTRHDLHGGGASSDTAQLAYGIGVTIVGVILTLAMFGLADPTAAFRYWPVGLMIAGGVGAIRAADGPSRVWSWFWIVLGTWLLARTAGQIQLGFWDLLWPMALIGLGVKLWIDALKRGEASQERTAPALGPSASHLTAILAGSTRVVQEPVFPGASMTTVLGNCTLDMRHAGPPAGGEAVIEVFALLGAHDIIVPEGWTIVSEVTTIGASIDDRTGAAPTTFNVTAPKLILRGVLILSGMTIKR